MERIRLDIIPKGLMPVCHASQYDAGRVIRLDLMDGLQGYSLTDEEIELNVRKPDGHIVTASVDVVEGQTYVDIVTTEQMCAVEGENICELKISKDNAEIYSLNFRMMVEKSVTKGGDPSESFVYNLRTQIAEGVAEEVATQYDSANVIFDAEPTENHGIGYAVTSEGIKTAIDNAFDYDNTASGSLVHITDGADNIPVKSLVSQIVAVESGSGEKSPTNPYTISGFDSGVVTRTGKNICSLTDITKPSWYSGGWLGTSLNDNEGITQTRSYMQGGCGGFVLNLKAGTYTFSCETNPSNVDYSLGVYCSVDGQSQTVVLEPSTPLSVSGNRKYKSFTLENDCEVVFRPTTRYDFPSGTSSVDINYIQIEVGDTVSEFEAYNGNTYTFAFGQTVYGGYFDNKGNLVLTHKVVDLGSLNWSDDALHISGNVSDMLSGNYASDLSSYSCEQFVAKQRYVGWVSLVDGDFGINGQTIRCKWSPSTTGADFKTLVTGCKFKYPLATPITLPIASQDIPTLLGENNIYSDTGDVDVTIRADIGLYIDKRLNVSRLTPNNLVRAAAYVDDPESVNETQEDNVEPQVDTQENNDER